jgi:hypothetical protein
MFVQVMHVRDVWVRVLQAPVSVGVGVRFSRRIVRQVLVLVMIIVNVRMHMLHRLMNVLVLVMLGQMQPHADGHQQARC